MAFHDLFTRNIRLCVIVFFVRDLLFYYRKGKNIVQVGKKLREMASVKKCFSKFRSDNFDVKNVPRFERLI